MRKFITLTILSVFTVIQGFGQNCFIPARKGVELHYAHYDGKGKPLLDNKSPVWTRLVVEEVWPGENGDMVINVLILNHKTDGIDREKYEGAYIDNMIYGDVKLEGDSVVFDNMHGLLLRALGSIPRISQDNESITIEMDAACTFPRKLFAGLQLPDVIVLNFSAVERMTREHRNELLEVFQREGFSMASFGEVSSSNRIKKKTTMKNRKIEAQESVHTPAGTFMCFKYSYDLDEKNIAGINHVNFETITPCAEWISPEVGIVKRVAYNRKGKIAETMILESISTPE